MRGATAQKMTVTILGHPTSTGQVGGPDSFGLLGIVRGIEMQNDPGNLPPISAFRIGIEKAQIGYEVLFVVASEDAAGRSSVRYWRIEFG